MIKKELELIIEATIREARLRRHEYLSIEHILYALMHDERGAEIVYNCGGNVPELKRAVLIFFDKNIPKLPPEVREEPQPTVGFNMVLQRALLHTQSAAKDELDAGDLLASILQEEDSHAAHFLKSQGITRLDVLNYISHGISKVDSQTEGEPGSEEGPNPEDRPAPVKNPLEAFAVDLVKKAEEGDIDPLIGRRDEISRAIQILSRRRKNNPVFVGEPGVGKTAIVEGLALMIHEGKIPPALKDARIFMLDMGGMLAGTKFRGEFEARLKATIDALLKIPGGILFIDEIHTVVGAGATSGGSMDASNILKPFLNSGKLRCIGASTYEEFKNHFEKDRAFSRRFQKIELQEPNVQETLEVLGGLKSYYEDFHGVEYSDDALQTAAELSARYINDKFLPDKAIDVIDEAGAFLKLDITRDGKLDGKLDGNPDGKLDVPGGRKLVTKSDIEAVVARIAKIPTREISADDAVRLSELERELKARVFGQDGAIASLVTSIKRSRAGLGLAERPVGCFLFTGPTGVGKTEITKQLAAIMGVKFMRFDMSEYMEKHAVSRLIGAPPGYVGFDQGGLLTDEVRKHPYSVVLMDEVEKAHEDVFNILLQIMDYATLTDNNGKKADFRNVILVMTSNAGAREMDRGLMGFGDRKGDLGAQSNEAIKKLFSPEFRNRLDDIITFKHLTPEVMERVVDKFMAELSKQLAAKSVSITLTEPARKWLAEKGYDIVFGARPLSRVIQTEIKNRLSDEILFGILKDGGNVSLDVKDGRMIFDYAPKDDADGINAEKDNAEGGNAGKDTAEGGNAAKNYAEGDNAGKNSTEGDNAARDTAEGGNAANNYAEGDSAAKDTAEGGKAAKNSAKDGKAAKQSTEGGKAKTGKTKAGSTKAGKAKTGKAKTKNDSDKEDAGSVGN